MPENDNPFAPWNSPMHKDNPFAPHNGMDADNPFKPWNSPFGSADDLTRDERSRYGLSNDRRRDDDYDQERNDNW